MRHKSSRPADLHIIVRKVKYDYYSALKHTKYWFNNDPIVSHFFNALQSTFPEGEKLFIQAALDSAEQLVRKKKLTPQLKEDMQNFIKQEALHSQQHQLWTNALIDLGYKKMAKYAGQLKQLSSGFRKIFPPVLRLSITAAAEHYTATLAYIFTNVTPEILTKSLVEFRGLLLYHAMEELEHKSVCFDLYQELSGNYLGRIFGLFFATFDLIINIYIRFRYLMRKDGIWNKDNKRNFRSFLIGKRGLITGLLSRIKSYLKPSFHPWQTDDRELINQRFHKYQKELKIKPFEM